MTFDLSALSVEEYLAFTPASNSSTLGNHIPRGVGMQRIDWVKDQELLDSKLKNLTGVTLYLLSTGRNAWHSTWSERYRSDAALFATFEAAKAAAEKARNRGTTFEIEQYPGLAFYSVVGVVALVEFHSKQSFMKLRLDTLTNRLEVGTMIRDAIDPFKAATSEYWSTPFPSENSFIVVRSDLAEEFETLPSPTYLKKWGSVAWGSNFYLGWNEKNKSEETPITRILGEFTQQNFSVDFEEHEKELERARQVAVGKRESKEAARVKFNEGVEYLSSISVEDNSLKNQKEK
jgi:hypothetical protein